MNYKEDNIIMPTYIYNIYIYYICTNIYIYIYIIYTLIYIYIYTYTYINIWPRAIESIMKFQEYEAAEVVFVSVKRGVGTWNMFVQYSTPFPKKPNHLPLYSGLDTSLCFPTYQVDPFEHLILSSGLDWSGMVQDLTSDCCHSKFCINHRTNMAYILHEPLSWWHLFWPCCRLDLDHRFQIRTERWPMPKLYHGSSRLSLLFVCPFELLKWQAEVVYDHFQCYPHFILWYQRK